MSWLVKSANLSSLKNQLSNLAKEVLADVEEAVQEAVKEDLQDEERHRPVVAKNEDDWSQAEFVTTSSSSQYGASKSDSAFIAAFEDEKKALLLRIQELTSLLQKSTSEASNQLNQLRRQNEELELEVKVLQSDKEGFQQRIRAFEKNEKETSDLRRQLAETEEARNTSEKRLNEELKKLQKDSEAKQHELASTEELIAGMKADIDHLRRVNDDLETKRIVELKKLLEEREAAERKVNELMEELASVRRPAVQEVSDESKELALDYDDLFDKISYQIQVEASESAVSFARKLESFLKNINNSDSSSKSSIDALEDGLAQLAAYEEFDMVKAPKEIASQTESPQHSECAMSQTDMVTSADFVSQTEFEKYEVESQTEFSTTSDAVNQTDSDATRSLSASTLEEAQTSTWSQTDAELVEPGSHLGHSGAWSSFKDMASSASQTFLDVHDNSTSYDIIGRDAVSQTEVNLDSQGNQTDTVACSDQSTSVAVSTFTESVTSQTDFSGHDAIVQTEEEENRDQKVRQSDQSTTYEAAIESASSQTDFRGVDAFNQTQTVLESCGNQTELTVSQDQSTMYESVSADSGCQTESVDVSQFLQFARPVWNSFQDTPYRSLVAQVEAQLHQILSMDDSLAKVLDLMVATYKQLSQDLEVKLALQNQVGKFQNERNQLIQALQQKHQESVSYHSEVQKLSKALQENAKKRQNVADAAVQFSGLSDFQEEVTQLREREVLLTAEAINLKQTIEQIRNRHNQEIISLKDRLVETEKKLENTTSNQNVEQKCVLLTKRLSTLQQALDAIHKEKETEIQDATQRLRKQLESADREKQYLREEIATLKGQVHELEYRLGDNAELNEQLLKQRGTISSLQLQLERNEKHRNELREEIKRLKDATSNSVDRYLVANLICGYVTAPSNDKQRVLNLLSTVLSFTTEEKVKCGLVEQQQQIDAKTLSAAFLQFLEAESKARPKLPPLAQFP